MFDLYDYQKTGNESNDNLEILSNTIARLTVLTFLIFPNLKKLTKDNKEAIYDKFLDLVFENKCWKEHEIKVDDRTKNLDQVELKELINKIAELDFANDKFKMKPLIPSKSISPTSTQSLNKQSKIRLL